MATFIEDDETSKLIETYATSQGKTKTGALRDLLRRELKSAATSSSDNDRLQKLLAFVTSNPAEKSPISPNDIDSVYEYLDAN